MKKSILVIMVALATNSGINARVIPPQQDFTGIINTSLRNNTANWQRRMNRSWNNWSELQKKDVLLRLYEEGALSEDDVVSWDMNQIPQISQGG